MYLLILSLGTGLVLHAQLVPGFHPAEFKELLSISSRQGDSVLANETTPPPSSHKMVFRSPVVALDNRWDLWLRDDGKQVVISIRGTVNTPPSWMANVYAAMQPATGNIQLSDTLNFPYKLAENPAAAVHTGWLVGMAAMAPSIESHLRDFYSKGVRDVIILGHSQGGAIAYLLCSYLYYRIADGKLPQDIRFKTYCSAAPKPGNLYYAYDYDNINRGGWAMTVVNAADWVPESPFSIQQVTDFNRVNPFTNIKPVSRKQKLLVRLYGGIIYNKMAGSTRRAVKRYEKILGKQLGKASRKKMPGLQVNKFAHTMNYMRCGTPVILMPDSTYYAQYPDDMNSKIGIWVHHQFSAYYMLTDKYESRKLSSN